jgi:hypothetical protein
MWQRALSWGDTRAVAVARALCQLLPSNWTSALAAERRTPEARRRCRRTAVSVIEAAASSAIARSLLSGQQRPPALRSWPASRPPRAAAVGSRRSPKPGRTRQPPESRRCVSKVALHELLLAGAPDGQRRRARIHAIATAGHCRARPLRLGDCSSGPTAVGVAGERGGAYAEGASAVQIAVRACAARASARAGCEHARGRGRFWGTAVGRGLRP